MSYDLMAPSGSLGIRAGLRHFCVFTHCLLVQPGQFQFPPPNFYRSNTAGSIDQQGSTQQFTATGSFSDGSMQNITSTAQWGSSDKSVATIQSNTCFATGVGLGSSQITASLSGVVSTLLAAR